MKRSRRLELYLAAVAVLVFAVIRLFVYKPIIKCVRQEAELKQYKGVVRIWDIATTTVKGSKYSFLETICDDFSADYTSLRLELYKITAASAGDNIFEGFDGASGPDIIRTHIYGFDAPLERALSCDAECIGALNARYGSAIRNDYGDKLIVDVHCNACIILVNTDLLTSLNVKLPKENTGEAFLAFLEEVAAKAGDDVNVLDVRDGVQSFVPFYLSESGALDGSYAQSVGAYLRPDAGERSAADALYDFYSGKTVVFCGDLRDAAYLTRMEMRGNGFDFEIRLYPSDGAGILYINEITSYIFYDSGEEIKNSMLEKFALYLLSDEAQVYTENIGMLPCADTDIDYKLYKYLSVLSDKKLIRYTYRDEIVKNIIGGYDE
jgi:hypothetical protein